MLGCLCLIGWVVRHFLDEFFSKMVQIQKALLGRGLALSPGVLEGPESPLFTLAVLPCMPQRWCFWWAYPGALPETLRAPTFSPKMLLRASGCHSSCLTQHEHRESPSPPCTFSLGKQQGLKARGLPKG